MKRNPETKCPQCLGRGTIPLSGAYLETLVQLRKAVAAVGPLSGADIARRLKITNEAACNRLRELESRGFAKSERYGRKRLWRAVS